MNIYGYTRLNNRRTRPKKLGIKKQSAMIQEYATTHGLTVKKILSDVADTSVSLELPNLQKLMKLAEDGQMDMLIVARLDRLPRSIRPIHEFLHNLCKKNEVTLVSIEEGLDSSTESGQLALNVMDILAKWDARMISDRTKELIERKRAVGERVGHAPFGFMYENKKLIPVARELRVVYLIREKRDQESLSYHKIAYFLNEQRIPSKRGGKWYAETVKTLYESPIYNDTALQNLGQSLPTV